MNLDLGPELTDALQAESARSGQSPHEIVHDAIARHLSVSTLHLPEGTNSLDLLDRDDRF